MEKEEADLIKKQNKDLELNARRSRERKDLAYDLGFIAAKQKKSQAVNPYKFQLYESDEVVEKTEEQKEMESLSERWMAGYNRFKG